MQSKVNSGSPLERPVGFSRAVRKGDWIFVSATAAVQPNGRPFGKDAYAQARRILTIVEASLAELGAGMEDVVRTRVYLRRLTDWKKIARAHGEVLAEIRPAATFVKVAGFLEKTTLVEIEVDAISFRSG